MNDFLNEESAQPSVIAPTPVTTAADALKKPLIDCWEDELGELQPPSLPPNEVESVDE